MREALDRSAGRREADLKDPEFPLDPDLIYLNHAGVAPWSRAAI